MLNLKSNYVQTKKSNYVQTKNSLNTNLTT